MVLTVSKIVYQQFGQEEYSLVYYLQVNLQKLQLLELQKYSIFIPKKVNLQLEVMQMLLYGIQKLKELYHVKPIIKKLITTYFKGKQYQEKQHILFLKEDQYGMVKILCPNKEVENIQLVNLLVFHIKELPNQINQKILKNEKQKDNQQDRLSNNSIIKTKHKIDNYKINKILN